MTEPPAPGVALRLEAVGRLARGIAHDINTPIQFIGDSVEFLREGLDELIRDPSGDHAFLREEIPKALDAVAQGMERISRLVRAMTDMAHAGPREPAAVDVNRAVEAAVVVSGGVHRYIAEIEVTLGQVPRVLGVGAELQHAVVLLLVRASQVMRQRGPLKITTRAEPDAVVVEMIDPGEDQLGKQLELVRGIVEAAHGGTLVVERRAATTVVQLRLPRA